MREILCSGCIAGFLLITVTAKGQPGRDESIEQAMQEGSAAMKAGDFARAVAAYGRVTKLAPLYAEGFFNLGLADEQAGKLDEARAQLEKALRLKPSLVAAHLFLGTIAYRQNRFKDAEASFLQETRLSPRDAKAFMWLGVSRLAQDSPQAAIPPLEQAYALNPSDVDILYHRGRAYLLVANASYDARFRLDNNSLRVHQVLAESYAQAYRNEEAISEFEVTVKLAPHQPGLHEELGDQEWMVGKLDKAAEAYREELKIDSYAASSLYKLGSLLVRAGNAAEGMKLLQQALRVDPSMKAVHYYLGIGLAAIDQSRDAIGEFQQAIAADPSSDRAANSYYRMAQIYRKLNDVAEAQVAMQNFQRLRAETRNQDDRRVAERVRSRTELPVEDAEAVMAGDHP